MITPYMFWKRFDRLKREPLKDICSRHGIRYDRLLHNRSDCRLPKAEDLFALSNAVGVSVEYLLTGRHPCCAKWRGCSAWHPAADATVPERANPLCDVPHPFLFSAFDYSCIRRLMP